MSLRCSCYSAAVTDCGCTCQCTHTLSVAKLDAVAWWQAVRTFCESTLVLSGPIESWSLDLVDGGVHGQSGFVGEDVCKEPVAIGRCVSAQQRAEARGRAKP